MVPEVSCNNLFNSKINSSNKADIFVMGHVYETNNETDDGISQNLLNFLDSQRIDDNTVGIFSGDLVRSPNEISLMNAKLQIEKYFKNYFNAIGNHDKHESYSNIFGETFFSLETNNFLILGADFNTNNWLPINSDKNLINYIISKTTKKNILLISHPIFWLEAVDYAVQPNNIPDKVIPVEDPFKWIELGNKNLIVISGDSGKWGQEFYCEEVSRNITVISNGLGGYNNDSIIKILEDENRFTFERVKINN